MDPYLGSLLLFAGNFAINGFALCQGQILSIQQNTALFSILGTTYGGNGTTNFGLPDLQGRMPIGMGTEAGNFFSLGQVGGTDNFTLTSAQLPAHTHQFNVNTGAGTTGVPSNTTYLAQGPTTGSGPNATLTKLYTTAATSLTGLVPATISPAGSGQPFSLRNPYLAMTYLITLQGIYPSRS